MNWRSRGDYLYCPDCHRKTVILKMRSRGEDGYYCTRRACTFECFTADDSCQIDRENVSRLQEQNKRYFRFLEQARSNRNPA